MSYKTAQSPQGTLFCVQEEVPGGDMAALAAMVERSGRSPQEAREELRKLVNGIPDDNLNNFIGAQVTVVT